MYDFKANIAVMLNITPDHLDRYDYKMQNYINAKVSHHPQPGFLGTFWPTGRLTTCHEGRLGKLP